MCIRDRSVHWSTSQKRRDFVKTSAVLRPCVNKLSPPSHLVSNNSASVGTPPMLVRLGVDVTQPQGSNNCVIRTFHYNCFTTVPLLETTLLDSNTWLSPQMKNEFKIFNKIKPQI